MNQERLTGKRAIVAGGGGRGCGRACAEMLASAGAKLVICDRDGEGAHDTVRTIIAGGGEAFASVLDLCEPGGAHELFAFARDTIGGVDILVNAASRNDLFRPNQPLDFWDEILDVELLASMRLTREAVDEMRSHGGGAIVLFSSTSAFGHGRSAGRGSPAYDVAKLGVARLVTMLGYLAPEAGIRINCIAPDWVATPELAAYHASLPLQTLGVAGTPKRLTQPGEIAECARRLVSDPALWGRIVFWLSDDGPKLIAWGDRGYARLDPF